MAVSAQSDLPLFRFRAIQAIPGIEHGVSTRHGGVSRGTYGSLNLSLSVQDDEACVQENKRRLAGSFSLPAEAMLTTRQVHGSGVIQVTDQTWAAEDSPRADALITDRPGVLLMQRFADCVPILLASTRQPAIGIAHAGWRGTVQDVVGTTVAAMTECFGVDPGELVAGIGPSIGVCCFEVGQEVAEQFQDLAGTVHARTPRPHVDLWEANRQALLRAGVSQDAIEISNLCTRCHMDDFFSHRAMGFPAGRFAGVIGIQA